MDSEWIKHATKLAEGARRKVDEEEKRIDAIIASHNQANVRRDDKSSPLDQEIDRGLNDITNGRIQPAEEVFNELQARY